MKLWMPFCFHKISWSTAVKYTKSHGSTVVYSNAQNWLDHIQCIYQQQSMWHVKCLEMSLLWIGVIQIKLNWIEWFHAKTESERMVRKKEKIEQWQVQILCFSSFLCLIACSPTVILSVFFHPSSLCLSSWVDSYCAHSFSFSWKNIKGDFPVVTIQHLPILLLSSNVAVFILFMKKVHANAMLLCH